MKKLCICLLCLALLLCGCGGRENAERDRFAEVLSARHDLCFTADLRAEYADRSAAYTLRYEEDPEGCTLRVLEPEEIRDMSLRLDENGAQLRYDGISLDAGAPDRFGLSPVSALPALTKALREGFLDSSWTEEGQTVWELQADDGLRVRVWLDEGLIPRHAELISDGRVSVVCEIEDWT